MSQFLRKFPNLLAVYGTLKDGYHNNHLLTEAGFDLVGVTYTADPKFTLEGGMRFPIAREGGTSQILCELYQFSKFQQLTEIDKLEHHPTWYKRKLFDFQNGERAWMYVQPCDPNINYSLTRIRERKGVQKWI